MPQARYLCTMETRTASQIGSTSEAYAVVLGGANTDIVGFSDQALIARDSNPGHVCVSSGGVGRNIAENLARIEVPVKLVTAFGNDVNAARLRAKCVETGIDVAHSLSIGDLPGCVYLAIADECGIMNLALNDMRALDRVVPSALESLRSVLRDASVIVLDTNIGESTIEWMCEVGASVPIVLDPVSVVKSARARSSLGRLHTLKANEMEARALVGDALPGDAPIELVARELISTGLHRILITMGERGVYALEGDEYLEIPAPSVTVLSDTGAGDAFAAGAAWGAMQHASLWQTARFASSLASRALTTEETVDSSLSRSIVERVMEEAQ